MNNQDSIAITLASLVKNKEGLFVSEKQRDFILKSCAENNLYVSFTSAKQPSTLFYYLDEKGVVEVEKENFNHSKTTITFDRSIDKNIAERKRILREIKKLKQSISDRENSITNYTNEMDLYNSSMEIDKEGLRFYEEKLQTLG